MSPLVVPPVAVKSECYDLNLVRGLWQSARESVEAASRIVLMGYSAPATDLTLSAQFGNYVDPGLTCTVVDTAGATIVARLHNLGRQSAVRFQADQPIHVFVEEYERAVSGQVAPLLVPFLDQLDIADDDPVIARFGGREPEPRWPVVEVRSDGEATIIIARELRPAEQSRHAYKKV